MLFARSCDLTSMAYFLGGYVKNQVNKNNSQEILELEDELNRVIDEIARQL